MVPSSLSLITSNTDSCRGSTKGCTTPEHLPAPPLQKSPIFCKFLDFCPLRNAFQVVPLIHPLPKNIYILAPPLNSLKTIFFTTNLLFFLTGSFKHFSLLQNAGLLFSTVHFNIFLYYKCTGYCFQLQNVLNSTVSFKTFSIHFSFLQNALFTTVCLFVCFYWKLY